MKFPVFDFEFLRGANGGVELNRLVGALGGVAYILGANAFTAWNIAEGRPFDVTAYCVAFPGGLAVLGLGTAGAVAIKDRNVAAAHATESKTRTDAEAAGEPGRALEEAKGRAADATAEAATDKAAEIKSESNA